MRRTRIGALLLAMAIVVLPMAPATAIEAADEPLTTLIDDPQTGPIEPSADETPQVPTTLDVKNAQFRWGINNESNNAAFNPGTMNFFSAGMVADPGRGDVMLTEAGWSATSDNVSIQKWDGQSYQPATWAGLRTDSAEVPITNPTVGRFSNHTVVINGGSGTVDQIARSASISWDGDFTVLAYSGISFFYVSDPMLTVQNGAGKVTATLSGFGSSMEDREWVRVPPRTITVADLGPIDLNDLQGFNVTPRYAGATITGHDQVDSEAFGAFPQEFVDFQDIIGTAPYWYSSGGLTDPYKPPLPMTISYDASKAVAPTPPPSPTKSKPDEVTNKLRKPPKRRPQPTAPPQRPVPVATSPAPASVLPAATTTDVPVASVAFRQVSNPVTLSATAPATVPAPRDFALGWWLGAVFLTLACSSIAGTFAYGATMRRRP